MNALEVMDAARAVTETFGSDEELQAADEARAAVVELVQAHRSLLKLVNDNADDIAVWTRIHPDTLNAECDRSSAALAKFGEVPHERQDV